MLPTHLHTILDVSREAYIGSQIKPEMIQTCAPYYRDALFYVSGPYGMVDSVKGMLRKMGIPDQQIKTDFFAGL